MALARDRKRQNVKGGGIFKLREIDPTPADPFLDIGYEAGVTLDDAPDMVNMQDEKGTMVNTDRGAQTATLTVIMEQSGIDEINLRRLAAGRFYDLYYYVPLGNGKFQELSAPIAKLRPGINLQFAAATQRNIELVFDLLAPKANFTRTPTAFNVVADVPYTIVENVSAQNAPTDAAATLAGTIL